MARIYIAEDDDDVRGVLVFSLMERGHEVVAADDGDRLVEVVAAGSPDLLVLDIVMPNFDGYRVLDDLEAAGLRRGMKILVVTALSSERARKESFEHGADGFLATPFEPEEFVAAVEKLLRATPQEIKERREQERDQASLLAQLESVLGGEGEG